MIVETLLIVIVILWVGDLVVRPVVKRLARAKGKTNSEETQYEVDLFCPYCKANMKTTLQPRDVRRYFDTQCPMCKQKIRTIFRMQSFTTEEWIEGFQAMVTEHGVISWTERT